MLRRDGAPADVTARTQAARTAEPACTPGMHKESTCNAGDIGDSGSIPGLGTEAEDIKKRWQEYTEELYKKDRHDPDNHDGVITHLEPDILAHTPAACSFPGENARSWEALGEARPLQGAAALRGRAGQAVLPHGPAQHLRPQAASPVYPPLPHPRHPGHYPGAPAAAVQSAPRSSPPR